MNSQATLSHRAKHEVPEGESPQAAGKVPWSSQAAATGYCSQVEEVMKENIVEF